MHAPVIQVVHHRPLRILLRYVGQQIHAIHDGEGAAAGRQPSANRVVSPTTAGAVVVKWGTEVVGRRVPGSSDGATDQLHLSVVQFDQHGLSRRVGDQVVERRTTIPGDVVSVEIYYGTGIRQAEK